MIPGVTPEYCGKSSPLSGRLAQWPAGRFKPPRYVEHSPM